MESTEQIEKFKDFIDSYYKRNLHEIIQSGGKALILDFKRLSEFDVELAEELLNDPENLIRAAERSLELFDLPVEDFSLRIRFTNLPASQTIRVSDIREKNLNKFVCIEGIVRQASDVRPQVVHTRFECPNCGNIHNVTQFEERFRDPSRCSCGRRTGFRLLSKVLVDAQHLIIEEAPESLIGGEQPKRLTVFLREDLVEPRMEKKTTPGSKIAVYGVIKESPIFLKTGKQSTRYLLAMDANYIDPREEGYVDIDISREDEERIIKLANDPKIYDRLVNSIAPYICGHEDIKEALVLQLMGGIKKKRKDGTETRGDMHVLLVGDPGAAKSSLLMYMAKAAPKARYVAGKGASLDYNEPLLTRIKNKIKIIKIGEFIDKYFNESDEEGLLHLRDDVEALSLNLKTNKLEWRSINAVFRHKTEELLFKFDLESGREVTVSGDHSIFVIENGRITTKPARELNCSDYVVIPAHVPNENISKIDSGFSRLLGYYIADSWLTGHENSYTYRVNFALNHTEKNIMEDLNLVSQNIFNKIVTTNYKRDSKGAEVYINGRLPFYTFSNCLGSFSKARAKEKRVPEIIFNTDSLSRREFVDAYIKGDYGVTKSKYLMSDMMYAFLQDSIIASYNKRNADKDVKFRGRYIKSKGFVYSLKAPFMHKIFKNRYINYPISKLDNDIKRYLFKRIVSSDYSKVNLSRVSNNILLERLFYVYDKGNATSKEVKSIFGNCVLEYFREKHKLFDVTRKGRVCIIKLTKFGNNLINKFKNLERLCNGETGYIKIKKIEKVKPSSKFVYDISVPGYENFIGGFGGIVCHNSAAGLTATVVKDDILKGWALEAGALVLANGGFCALDELDKMDDTDRSAMHEALAQQRVTISKASIQATLKAETTVLAAANPKFGRFDPFKAIALQIDLPPTLINRFDLIFPVMDIPNRSKDEKIAGHVLNLQRDMEGSEPDIGVDILKKYIAYVRQKVFPILSGSAIDEIKSFYVNLRNKDTKEEGQRKPIPISARQLEALVRLAEGSARVRLSKTVTKSDAMRAIRLLKHCLMQVGFDYETQALDIDMISTGVSSSERRKIDVVMKIIDQLCGEKGFASIDNIYDLAREKKIERERVDEVIEKLKQKGDVFEPKPGQIHRL